MKTIRKLTRANTWVVMLIMAFLSFSAVSAMAANRTITLKTQTGGKFRYRIKNTDGSWGSWNQGAGGYYTSTQTVTVADGKVIQIAGYPNDDSHYFVSWTGYDTQPTYAPSWTVAQNRTYTLNVTTTARTVNLSVNNANYGSVRISGPFGAQEISTTSNTAVTVGQGATITLTATPASNRYFVNYTGTATQTTYVYTRTVPASNLTYKANFTTSYKNIRVKVNTANYGNVVLSGPFADKTITSTSYQTYKVGVGATVQLVSTPASGKYWMYYTVNSSSSASNATASYKVEDNRDYIANFTTSYKAVTVQVQSGGKIRVHNGVEWSDWSTSTITKNIGVGGTCTVQSNPNDNTHYFVNWTEGSNVISQNYNYSVVVQDVHTLKANYTTSHKTIKATASPATAGRVRIYNGWSWTEYGTTATVEVGVGALCKVQTDPSDGYGFLNWTKSGTTVSTEREYSFTVSAADTYQANFKDVWEGDLTAGRTYTVTTSSGNKFKVTCNNTSDAFHNKTYSYVGNLNAKSGTVTINFQNSAAVLFLGTIKSITGATLNVNASNGNRTLKKAASYDWMFNVDNQSTMKVNSTKTYTLTVDGGAVFNTALDGRTEWKNNSMKGRAFHANGKFEMYKSIVQNCFTLDHGAAFYCGSGSDASLSFVMQDVEFRGNQGPTVFLTSGSDWHAFQFTRVKFYHNMQIGSEHHINPSDPGGIFRTNGNTKSTMVMSNCEMYENRAMGVGGAILWNATGIPSDQPNGTKIIITGGTKLHDNVAGTTAGAFYISGTAELSNCEIYNNSAGSNGGGIYVEPNGGGHDNYPGAAPNLTIGNGTKIYGNSAGNMGGGVYFLVSPHNDVGWDDDGNPLSPEFRMEVKDGGYVYNNTAKYGGGIAILDRAANKHKNNNEYQNEHYPLPNPAYNVWSGVYKRNVVVSGGAVYGNQATGGYGAGIYIEKYAHASILDGSIGYTYTNTSLPDAATNTGAAGTITVDIKGGLVYNNESINGSGGGLSIRDNLKANYPQYGSLCDVIVEGTAKLYGNKADNDGGGIHVASGNLTMNAGNVGCESFNFTNAAGTTTNVSGVNKANNGNGGGFFVSGGTVTVQGGTIAYNEAAQNGGGFYVNVPNTTDLTTIKNGATVTNNKALNGAGAYINKGALVIQDAATKISSNTATTSGGGIYMANGTVTFTNAKLQSNTATNNDGGGLYLGNGTITISGTNSAIQTNKAKNNGGGIYVGGGTLSMSGGTIGGTTANGNRTTGNTSYGGGLYMGGGTATLSGGTISGNQTDSQGHGGGIYMNGGTCTLSNGATIGGASGTYANSAKFGGGIYSAGGTITVKGGKLQHNTASTAGGGIYTNGADGVVNMEKQTSKADMLSYIEYNTAEEGGGIYANRGVVNFSDGFIQYNHASEAGGGIYVNDNGGDDYGTLYLKGSANLRRNNVPEGHSGGGVYLKGKVVVGEQTADLGIIKAQENFAGDEYVYEWNDTGHPETDSIDQVTANNRNNIYLPDPGAPSVLTTHRDVITVIENGISLQSNVGFSVPHNYVPVIYCAPSSTSQDYLDQFSTGHEYQYMLFDDTRHYVAVHYPDRPDIFDRDHVYLYGFWANVVTGNEFDLECPITAADFEGQNPIEISNACELAFFISWVNGLNGLDTHADANAILLADIDMSKYGWVPIGDLTHGYSGTFDGNGHTVTGISSLLYREYLDYGFFGRLDGGTVKDLFVKDASYALDNMPDLVIGGLVGEITTASTVENCEVSSRITATNTTTVVGGLIGRMNAGTVHSTIGISDMKGYLMGGLVGELLGGNLYNSFSNCKYTKAESHDKYMGGLAAVNRGTVENCYVRLLDNTVLSGSNFGILVGDNTGGVVNYCYAPAGMTNYKVTGANPIGHGNYGDSFLPYLYGHRDTQVSLANSSNGYVPTDASADKQMMVALNNWVEAKSTASVAYTTWGRPWHESNAVKPLNDDYPILKMPMAEAVGAKAGDPYLYYNPVDSLLVRYTDAESAIWLYRNPADVVRGDNSSSEAKLYIAEDVALKNLNELKAYVGITLDNSAGGQGANPTYGQMVGITSDATDWHMISSPLMDAPIGIDYSDNGSYDFSWGHPEGMPYYLFFPKGNARNGYFPSHRFGESYPTSDATIEAGSYYNEWDFYSYSEPNYHWINFKRNSNSHRHFDTETHEPISYGNEPSLIPGKGYFAATREETFLQCQGNLNADEVILGLTMTSGVPRHGYNLIGNPYQAYLDFDAFAECNSDDVDAIWDDKTTASYTILDEDAASYLTFAYDGSDNPDAAGRFIHPHQGFFVRTGLDGSMAYFQPDMRNTTARNSTFRSNDHIDYPLVNLFVSEANGNSDMVTVELGRPTQGGALLMQGLRAGNGKIWCHYNDVDYAVAYTQPGVTEAAIRFETVVDTEYTMRWNTHNGDFSYLHLIDNVTGADVDCLTTDEYRFSASTSDYKSRFRLVFGYTGIEEDSEAEANENFAFMMNDALVVTGEGVLQVFDVTGRMVMSQELHGVQTTVSLPNAANGVYVLRLTEGKQSRIQKMVISK